MPSKCAAKLHLFVLETQFDSVQQLLSTCLAFAYGNLNFSFQNVFLPLLGKCWAKKAKTGGGLPYRLLCTKNVKIEGEIAVLRPSYEIVDMFKPLNCLKTPCKPLNLGNL